MDKAIVLVDGQNLFYSLKNLSLTESMIDWGAFLKNLVSPTDRLVRTYWFRPAKLHYGDVDTHKMTDHIIRRDYSHTKMEFFKDRNKITPEIKEKAAKELEQSLTWIQEQESLFERQETKYEQKCIDYDNVQIVKSGYVKLNPYKRDWIGEKGVDICLAVKMIEFSEKCDKIILISGDYDYAEAINYVKNQFKTIHIVKFHKGFPPKNKNMSRGLTALADKIIDVYEADLRANFLKTTK